MRPLVLLLLALDGECITGDPPDWSLEDRAEECGITIPPMQECRRIGSPQARIRCRDAIEAAECEALLAGLPECRGICK